MKKVTASAPGKLMIVGGYAVVHGRPTIVTAVDQRLSVTVEENGEDVFHLDAPDLGLTAYKKTMGELGGSELPKAVRFIETLYKNFLQTYPKDKGIVVTTKSDFSASFGFGSSSAVTVAFAKALTTLYGLDLSKQELFDMCYQTVIEVQGVGSGFDIAAAIWGGTLKYVKPAKVVEEVSVRNPAATRGELPIIVGYTGVKADTPTLIRMVDAKLEKTPEKINDIFDKEAEIAEKVETALQNNELKELGSLLNEHQDLMRKLGVSGTKLEELISASLNAGAYGATLSGAGGGDCMLAVVDDSNRVAVEQAITEAGGEVMKVGLGEEGVKIT